MKLGSALWLGAALCTILAAQTSAPVAATINIYTSVTTPVYPNFSGVSADLELPAEYWDYRFNTYVINDRLVPGALSRHPR